MVVGLQFGCRRVVLREAQESFFETDPTHTGPKQRRRL
jgi:hypothetical protein